MVNSRWLPKKYLTFYVQFLNAVCQPAYFLPFEIWTRLDFRFLNELLSRDLVQPNLGWYLIGQDKITEKSVWEQDKMVCYMEYGLIVKLSATGHLQFEYWTSPVICNYSSNFLWTSWSSKTGIINLIHKKLSWRVIQKNLIQILTWLILLHLILLKYYWKRFT